MLNNYGVSQSVFATINCLLVRLWLKLPSTKALPSNILRFYFCFQLIEYKKTTSVFFTIDIAPPGIQVACFIGANNLQDVLGDFSKEIKWDNTNEVVKKCAKLAHAKDYKLFALGQNGRCLSGPNTRHRYYISGTDGAYCKDGIGMGNSIFVYALGMFVFVNLSYTVSFPMSCHVSDPK